MIHYVVSADRAYCLETYLRTWGRASAERFNVISYRHLGKRQALSPGTYVFTDLERLPGPAVDIARRAWDRLADASPTSLRLNHPARALRRLDLLGTLHAQGLSAVRAFRLTEARRVEHFPVFLRSEAEHLGSFTPLLYTQRQVDLAALKLRVSGIRLSRTLVVEFLDTSDEGGLFRKYSAFYVGGRVVPRHLIFSREWVLKTPDLLDDAKLREEMEYLETNPHRDWIDRMFRIARIEYGRIDYAVNAGRPQIWEINTNPQVMMAPEKYDPRHVPAQRLFAARIADAFASLNDSSESGAPVPFAPPRRLVRRLARHRIRTTLARVASAPGRRVILPLVRRAYHIVKRYVEPEETKRAGEPPARH